MPEMPSLTLNEALAKDVSTRLFSVERRLEGNNPLGQLGTGGRFSHSAECLLGVREMTASLLDLLHRNRQLCHLDIPIRSVAEGRF